MGIREYVLGVFLIQLLFPERAYAQNFIISMKNYGKIVCNVKNYEELSQNIM